MSARRRSLNRLPAIALGLIVCLAAAAPAGALSPPWTLDPYLLDSLIAEGASEVEPPGHLVVSEVMTGGASALDEFIEIHNPTAHALPLEGLEVVYVTASGATISRRAMWSAGAASVPPGGHVLIAHESGIFAPIADVVYGSGIAAAGGSVAIRILGAGSAIDAVGWGTASSSWLEGTPAPAPAAGSSLERLPGGTFGSWQDTDDNAVDFVIRTEPEPQNSGAPPTPGLPQPSPTTSPSLSPTPSPIASPTPLPSVPPGTPTSEPSQSPTPAPTSSPEPLTVTEARARPNGTTVTVAGYSLTDSAFTEGGGYLADDDAGIAVLLSSGEFARGARLMVTGQIDDRFHQRTIRATAAGVTVIGAGQEPTVLGSATGSIGEAYEGRLVRIRGIVLGAPTSLVAGLAYDVSDGSGAIRVLVGPVTGIDSGSWAKGVELELVGVVGQRDSTGGGTAGYRVQPRDAGDILAVVAPFPSGSPGPSASPGPTGAPTPSPSAPPRTPLVTIAVARSYGTGTAARVRGVVTAPSGLVAPGSAVLQDGSAAILLRHSDEVGPFVRGEFIEVEGTRATLSGMLSLRITRPATRLGSQAEPSALRLASGALAEAHEARLIVVRGAVATAPRRSTANNVFFSIDDGSGAAAVAVLAASGIQTGGLARGAWVEIEGVLGQETTGSQPDRGYRIWPRDGADLRIIASPTGSVSAGNQAVLPASGVASAAYADFSALDVGSDGPRHDLTPLMNGEESLVHATLVVGEWPELELAGLLWDGERLAAIALADDGQMQVRAALGPRRPPLAVSVSGRGAPGSIGGLSLDLIKLAGPQAVVPEPGPPAAPSSTMPSSETPTWVRLVGSVDTGLVRAADPAIDVEVLCGEPALLPDLGTGPLIIEGIGLGGPGPRLIVPCGGLRPMPTLAVAVPLATPDDRPLPSPPGDTEIEPTAAGDVSMAGALVLLIAAGLALASLSAVALRSGGLQRIAAEGRRILGRDGAGLKDAPPEVTGVAGERGVPPALSVIPVPDEIGRHGGRNRVNLP